MARSVFGLRLGLVNVRADHAIEIAPPNHNSHRDTAFVDSLGVIGHPYYSVRDTGVDA